MTLDLEEAARRAATLNAALEPRANRPVDIGDPDWLRKLRSQPHPLDEAGVREQAEALLDSLLDAYATGDEGQREAIRALLAENRAFIWATGVQDAPTTVRGFRKHLLRLSAENGGRDIRDTIVAVDALCADAKRAGLDVRPALEEVAALSSDATVHGMTSVRRILLRAR